MNQKIMRVMGILLAVMAAAAVLTLGINWARAAETAAPAQTTAAQASSAFSYQGRLVYNGTAVNGTCDLTFRLYDAASFGTQIGFNLNKSSVAVNNGFFTVDLDFGDGVFNGEARYLQITIDSCTNGASSVTLSPLIELTAAPYALGLRPGAIISETAALTWKPITSTLSIPAAAFSPQDNVSEQTYNSGTIIQPSSAASSFAIVQAPVQLPDGATITSMKVYWYDDYAGDNGDIKLYRSTFNSIFPLEMAAITTNGAGGNGDNTITSFTATTTQIDNTQYGYYVSALLPTDGTNYVGLYGVVIEYTTTGPH